MPLLSLIFVVASQSGYAPAFLPNILTGSTPNLVYARPGNFRGYRPVYSEWWAGKTMAEARAAAVADGEVFVESTDRAYKILSDRVIEIDYAPGKFHRQLTSDGKPTEVVTVSDRDSAVTCMVTERPLITGPLPDSWFSGATTPSATPSDFVGFPTAGITSAPTAWYETNNDSAHPWYFGYWAFSDPSGTTVTQIKQQLTASGHWSVDGDGADSTSLASTTYAFITFADASEFPELPAGWKSAKVGWGDPAS